MTPVAIVANKVCRNHEHGIPDWTGHACTECTEWAGELLTAVHGQGWRIVKTDPYARGEIAVAARDDEVVEVTEEWKP